MSESVSIGEQSFIKDPKKGWIDKKTKQPADKGLLRLLDSLDIQPVKARLKVDIDNSIEPITLGPNEKYVFDKNIGWINAKTKQPAAPDMLKLLNSLKSKVNGAQDTSKPTKPKAAPKAKPKPKLPKEEPEPLEVPPAGSKLKAFGKGAGKALASGGAAIFGIDLQQTLDEEKEKKEEAKARYQEIVDTYYTVEETESGAKKYRDAKTGKYINPAKAAAYDILATQQYKIEKRKQLVRGIGKGLASGALATFGIDLQQTLDEEKEKREKAAEFSAEKETEAAKTKKEPKGSKSLDKPSISVLSNSFTDLITSFNGMDVYSKNINAIFKAQSDAAADVAKENALEKDITPSPITSGGGDSSSEYLANALPDVTEQLNTLTELINGGALQGSNGGSGFDPTDLLDFGKKGGRFARFAAPAVAAAAATGAILYGTDKFIKNTNEDARKKQDSGISQFGITGDNFEGFVINGKNVGGRENLPEYYKNVVDGYGANNRGGSAERARQYVETHNPDGSAKRRSTPKGTGATGAGSDAVKMSGASPRSGESASVKQQNLKTTTQAVSVKDKTDKAEKQRQNILSGKTTLGGFGSKLSGWLGGTFQNVSTYVSHIPDRVAELVRQGIAAGSESLASSFGVGTGSYAEASLGGAKGDWVKDGPFISEVNRVSQKFNIDAGDLLGMMQSESGINPAAHNKSGGASGLIQFMPATAKGLGTTTEAIRGMSRAQQMPLVEKYFNKVGLPRGASAGQLYTSVFLPAFVKKPSSYVIASPGGTPLNQSGSWYKQNKGLDVDQSGAITISDLTEQVSRKRKQIGLGPSKVVSGFTAFSNAAGNFGSDVADTAYDVGAGISNTFGMLKNSVGKLLRLNGGITGNARNLANLHPEFEKRLVAAFTEYKARTGHIVTMTSGFRYPGDQARIDSGSNPKALPGTSRHEVGQAMDINPPDVAIMNRLGILQKYGLLGGRAHNRSGATSHDPPHVEINIAGKLPKPAAAPTPKPVPPKVPPVFKSAADRAIDTVADAAKSTVVVVSDTYNNAKANVSRFFGYAPYDPPPKPQRRGAAQIKEHLAR